MSYTTHVYNYLDCCGINKGLKGYLYLADAITFMLEHPEANIKEYYISEGEKYNIPAANVSNCIRYSIASSKRNQTSGKPRAFIRSACYEIRQQV